MRKCTRRTCPHPAVAALTCDYGHNTVVIGPLPMQREPYATELCEAHVAKFTAPLGWEIIRLASNFEPAPPSPDDILALAEVVREVSNQRAVGEASTPTVAPPSYTRQSPNHPSVLAAQSRAQEQGHWAGRRPAATRAKSTAGPQWGPFSPDPRTPTRAQTGADADGEKASAEAQGAGEHKLRIIDSAD